MTRNFCMFLVMLMLVVASGPLLGLAPPQPEKENYSLIEEGLYMGGLVAKPPPGTKAVLNLCGQRDYYRCEHYVWRPIDDGDRAPDLAWLRRQVEFIEARRKAGDTVYVHCAAGRSRSGMVVIAYEMYKRNWTRDEALRFVRSKRPVTQPNPAFWDRLREWQFEVRDLRRAKDR
ncbi:MAG: dual specificity protein phosphatase family protein [Planctomycetes bacterium]|nr:dual specificity protein phosphatase family protein [Planctomycetota bacterium]